MDSIEIAGYAILGLGTILDQVSTRICMSKPNLYEANLTVQVLIEKRLWLPIDLSLVTFIVVPIYLLLQEKRIRWRRQAIVIPLWIGLMRIIVSGFNVINWLVA